MLLINKKNVHDKRQFLLLLRYLCFCLGLVLAQQTLLAHQIEVAAGEQHDHAACVECSLQSLSAAVDTFSQPTFQPRSAILGVSFAYQYWHDVSVVFQARAPPSYLALV